MEDILVSAPVCNQHLTLIITDCMFRLVEQLIQSSGILWQSCCRNLVSSIVLNPSEAASGGGFNMTKFLNDYAIQQASHPDKEIDEGVDTPDLFSNKLEWSSSPVILMLL